MDYDDTMIETRNVGNDTKI